MRKLILTVFASFLVAAALPGLAAKGGSCKPALPAPLGLTVSSDGSSVLSQWNDVDGAVKYSVEITASYDGHDDVTFVFTAFDADPGVLATTSLSVPLSELVTQVCNDPPDCTSVTLYTAKAVSVRVKALNPPTPKGKDQAQCNPFSDPVTATIEDCPCFSLQSLGELFPSCPATDAGCTGIIAIFGSGHSISIDSPVCNGGTPPPPSSFQVDGNVCYVTPSQSTACLKVIADFLAAACP
jgi:hypothetical protein